MAKLVDVYHPSKSLNKRQLPLIVDESLTMVMDLKSMGLVCDNQQVRGKELEDFTRKMALLTPTDLNAALQVTRFDMLHVLNQAVPCVGCRRSVERLYYQLFKYGHPTLDPIIVKPDGIITIREEKQSSPQVICSLFQGHSTRLNDLVDSQLRRNKKSHRCLLHSLDTQRSRPISSAWRDAWDSMRPECKRDICIVNANTLHATLETYLRKHRFCGECRTKVLKAYTLLMDEPEPCKEKGYVSALYAGIKRCLSEKHIHLQTKTEYISKLISRAEPELLGSRRERHAKTLEIAQEEVLTCLGICMYERLHRIYIRMREEECTCRVFAAVAVDALCRSFETAVECKRGVTQLELLYAELTKEEQQKQLRKEQKKLKRKRKKEKMAFQEGKENCNNCENEADSDEKEDCLCLSNLDRSNESLNCKDCDDDGNNISHNNQGTASNKDCCTANEIWMEDCKCSTNKVKKKNGSSSDHSHDCGYSSENNNGCCETVSLLSSLPSSPEGSEMACSDICCQPEHDYLPHSRFSYGNGNQLSLQEMLEDHFYCDDDSDCYITAEEVLEFKTNNRQVFEKRKQLRETLQKRFALLCVNGPLQVPRLLIQTKYASN